ncbi:TMEM165/GDT1 family protein [Castellaniella sp. GW247-6E4]|uniref:TMEM165/GDT1 family protein n=1 Tax=Castellaniella sp. GW247-6E4 TaxID=3140380 RepID=UPI003315AF99
MDAFLISTGIVALSEMGDKTQLLAIVLAARFKRPWTICLGILLATLANHALAGLLGIGAAHLMGPQVLRWTVGLSMLAMAGWLLIPDRIDEKVARPAHGLVGVLGATLTMFFLAEMGDKTQIATIALAARYDALVAVVCGTTAGMMLANAPAVFLGEAIARRVPMRLVHGIAAAVFAVLGVLTLLDVGHLF